MIQAFASSRFLESILLPQVAKAKVLMEDIKRAISTLESLIRAHYKRIIAYSSLCEMTSNEEIKSICKRHMDQSTQTIKNLSAWRSAYGGFARNSDASVGRNTWHRIKLFLSFNPERTMIGRCDQLEREIGRMYEQAMPLIPASAAGDLQAHVKALMRMRETLREFAEGRHAVEGAASPL